MKTKIALAVALVALFVAVPGATLKAAKPASLTFSVGCDTNDVCQLNGSGFGASTSYKLVVTDSCGGNAYTNDVSTDSSGGFTTAPAVPLSVSLYDGSCPSNTGWTFTLSTLGRRSSQVATFTATDNGGAGQ